MDSGASDDDNRDRLPVMDPKANVAKLAGEQNCANNAARNGKNCHGVF